jgi:cytochrome c oxidase subunit II
MAALAAAALCAVAGAAHGADPLGLMPESASAVADEVDDLTYMILVVTGVTFVGVQAALVWFLFRYRKRPGGAKAKYTHGNHTVEMVWTVAPALVLVFLALYQMGLWVRVKSAGPAGTAGVVGGELTFPEGTVRLQVFARQFEWNFRYAGPDGVFDTADDLLTNGSLVVPVDRPVVADLRAMDVIHSFFLPNFRFKQDALPGVTIPIWFQGNKLSHESRPVRDRHGELRQLHYWDVVCAELCGDQHTYMAGRLYVVSTEDYERWLAGEQTSVPVPVVPQRGFNTDPPLTALDRTWVRWAWQDDLSVKRPPPKHKNLFGEDYVGDEAEDDF